MNGTYTKTIDLGQIDPNPDNYNAHNADQLIGLQDSLRQFGYVRRIVVQEQKNGRFLLVAGEGVFTAAKLENYQDLEATVIPHDWPIEKVNAYLVADNLHAQQSTPDEKKLLKIVEAARQYDEELAAAIGVADDRYQSLLKAAGRTTEQEPETAVPEIDAADELQAKYGVLPGDIWRIGQHFVLCGDCTDPESWARLYAAMGIDSVQGVFTSPPYAEQRKQQYGGVPSGEYVDWWAGVQDNVRGGLAADGSFFVNIKPHTDEGSLSVYVYDLVLAHVRRWGWLLKDEFCWERNGMPGDPSKMGKFKNQWEPIFWLSLTTAPKFRPQNVMHQTEDAILDKNYKPGLETSQGKGGSAVMGIRDRGEGMAYPGNRLSIFSNEVTNHPAAFPIELPAFFIKAFSDNGDAWLDPFAGSGSTLIAAHRNGRIGAGMELLPKYVSVCLERMALATGQEPERI